MATQNLPINNPKAFDQQYVSTNIRPGAPTYSSELVAKLRADLCALDEDEFGVYSYSLLTAMFIGAHRGDFVPRMFQEAIADEEDEKKVEIIFYTIRECIMAIWAFVGVPWCVPACLGIVGVLQQKGIEHLGAKSVRPREPMDVERLLEAGKAVNQKTYEKVNNPEVRELLSVGFPEMRLSISAMVWGYNVGGASKSGYLSDMQTELLIATSIIASGASRQSRSHVKASLGMGNSFKTVKKVVEIVTEFVAWNQTPLPHLIDVDQLAKEVANNEADKIRK